MLRTTTKLLHVSMAFMLAYLLTVTLLVGGLSLAG